MNEAQTRMNVLEKLPKDKLHKILNQVVRFAITAFFFAQYPTLLFLIYLENYDVFSYDLFSEGRFGIVAFFYLSLIFSLVLTLMVLFPFFCVWILKRSWNKPTFTILEKLYFGTSGLVMLGIAIFIFSLAPLLVLFFALPTLIPVVLTWISQKLKTPTYVGLSIFLFSLLLVYTVVRNDLATQFVSLGLSKFGVGGMLQTEVVYDNGEIQQGNLILLSPEVVFVYDGDRNHIINRSKAQTIVVGRKGDADQTIIH